MRIHHKESVMQGFISYAQNAYNIANEKLLAVLDISVDKKLASASMGFACYCGYLAISSLYDEENSLLE